MANTDWIATRRDEVSQLLVDSLQTLGSQSQAINRDSHIQIINNKNICKSPSQHTKPTDSSCSQKISGLKSQSTKHDITVPKLDIDALTTKEPCHGTKCRFVCANCGALPAVVSDRESISVISPQSDCSGSLPSIQRKAEISDLAIFPADSDDDDHIGHSNFLLDKLVFDDRRTVKTEMHNVREIEDSDVDETIRETSLISVCCVDAAEIAQHNRMLDEELPQTVSTNPLDTKSQDKSTNDSFYTSVNTKMDTDKLLIPMLVKQTAAANTSNSLQSVEDADLIKLEVEVDAVMKSLSLELPTTDSNRAILIDGGERRSSEGFELKFEDVLKQIEVPSDSSESITAKPRGKSKIKDFFRNKKIKK